MATVSDRLSVALAARQAVNTSTVHSGFVIDTLAAGVTQLLLRLRGLITLPLIAKLLGTAEYGIWAQVLAFIALTSSVVGLNLHIPMVRFVSAERQRSKEVYATLLATTVILAATTAAILYIFSEPLGTILLKGQSLRPYIELSGLLIVFTNIRVLNLNAYRATGRIILRSIMDLMHALGETIGVVAVIVMTRSLFDVFVFMDAWECDFVLAQTPHVLNIKGCNFRRRAVLICAIHT